jgi:hypothetical protein
MCGTRRAIKNSTRPYASPERPLSRQQIVPPWDLHVRMTDQKHPESLLNMRRMHIFWPLHRTFRIHSSMSIIHSQCQTSFPLHRLLPSKRATMLFPQIPLPPLAKRCPRPMFPFYPDNDLPHRAKESPQPMSFLLPENDALGPALDGEPSLSPPVWQCC